MSEGEESMNVSQDVWRVPQPEEPWDTWSAAPSEALWYGEVIGSKLGEDIDYVYGYSSATDEPDIDDLVPEGWVVEEGKILPTPRNPAWVPVAERREALWYAEEGR
jgi:hypothetical protein